MFALCFLLSALCPLPSGGRLLHSTQYLLDSFPPNRGRFTGKVLAEIHGGPMIDRLSPGEQGDELLEVIVWFGWLGVKVPITLGMMSFVTVCDTTFFCSFARSGWFARLNQAGRNSDS